LTGKAGSPLALLLARLSGSSSRVRTTLQRAVDGFVFSKPKTANSRRRIALPKRVQVALVHHTARQLEERRRAGPGWHDLDLVFPTQTGEPMDGYNVLRQSFFPFMVRAGLPRMRFHDLRHTAATLLLERGINPKIVAEMLGKRVLRLRSSCIAM
jgi:integrase